MGAGLLSVETAESLGLARCARLEQQDTRAVVGWCRIGRTPGIVGRIRSDPRALRARTSKEWWSFKSLRWRDEETSATVVIATD
jgi:hypothetical protein